MMTVRQVADELAVSPRFVYRLCANGAIECYKLGSNVRISKEALERYMEAQKKGVPQKTEVPRRRSPTLSVLKLRG